MSDLAFVVRMAWREGRAAARRLLLLTVAVAAGVGALVAINSFTDNLRESVARQAQALLGADLAFQSRREFTPRVDSLIDSLGGREARTVAFGAMTYVARTSGARLAQATAVTGSFPFYGEIVTSPAGAWAELQRGRNTIVDPSLLAALGAEVGDSLTVGETAFAIIGTIVSVPGDVGIRSAFGPRIFLAGRYLDETNLLGFGARAEYEAYLQLPPGTDPQAVAEHYRPQLRPDRVRIRTVADDRERLDAALTRLGNFLGLVALVALLLGGLGVASAVHVFIRQKLDTVAVLRCLGATSGQVFAIYLLQAAVMGLLGSVVGAALGLVVQQALPALLSDLVPVDVVIRPSWRSVVMGIGTGLWVAIVFALLPLLGVRRVPPLAALRRDFEPVAGPREPARWMALALLAASVLVLAVAQAGDLVHGLAFSGSIAGAIALLALAAWLLIRLARRRLPAGVPYVWRQGLANLHRPANQTMMVVLAIGFGAFLLATLFLVQQNLLNELDVSSGSEERPNFVFFDVQPDQHAPLDTILDAAGVDRAPPVPIVPMRILSLRGQPVSVMLADTTDSDSAPRGWTLRREYRSTYRDSLTDSERLIEGSWWSGGSGSPVEISVEQELALDLGVEIGDEIVWDIQGVPLASRVRSIRTVDWARFEPNFFVVFAPGALERAPHSIVTLARIDDPALRGRLQRIVAERFPNVTSLDLTMLQAAIEQLVGRVSLAIRFMALFSLITGVLVLVGAIATSRYQRVREGALLKTLGATRSQVLRVVFAEYLALGLLAATAAVGLSAAAGWALARFMFEVPFAFPVEAIAGVIGLTSLLTVCVGVWGSVEVIRKTPLEVLRAEAT
ncbi:MAG TPA: FtsX-like permease family protein [Gemmatimonadales bacterium]|nr:FtsX-like permease family protein [Gemmatimonadales bacterium]